MFLISTRSLASRTRQDPGAAILMAEVDVEIRMPEVTSLYTDFKQKRRSLPSVG